MKPLIPDNLVGKDLFNYLIENKDKLIAAKKSLPKYTEPVAAKASLFTIKKGAPGKKSEVIEQVDEESDADATAGAMNENTDALRVKVVSNTCNWCDSQMDVLLRDSAKRTIKERKGMLVHLHDHIHSIEAKVGEVADVYLQDMNLADLGINQVGFTQVIIFETDLYKSYNEKIFNQYRLKKINQHSIGLLYVKIELAINDPDYEKEMDFWNKYYPLVINKDVVDEKGYFWVVSEIKLMENSCVLFGSNEITPTLDISSGTKGDPAKAIPPAPPANENEFNWSEQIKSTQFF